MISYKLYYTLYDTMDLFIIMNMFKHVLTFTSFHCFKVCDGEWRVFLINGDIIGPYVSIANSNTFTVSGGTCSYTGPCDPATSNKSPYTHKIPADGDDVRKVAFSSCYKPANQISTALWDHVRGDFGADVWVSVMSC